MRWRARAACRHIATQVFFPKDAREPDAYEPARLVCAHCTVKPECLDIVIGLDPSEDRWGMFGGLTPHERRRLRENR